MRNLNKKEVNILKISNISHFLDSFGLEGNRRLPYRSPFEILADLENEILLQNNPEKTILIPYKDGGDAIFDLVNIDIVFTGAWDKDGARVVEYQYTTTIS